MIGKGSKARLYLNTQTLILSLQHLDNAKFLRKNFQEIFRFTERLSQALRLILRMG
jgi:hypothetical protein